MLTVCIVSPAWGRFDVTRLVLAQRQRLCVELASRGIEATSVIVADDENLEIAAEYGCETVRAENRPLGKKCNAGFRYALERTPDFICWIGSDDWIHPDVFDPLLERTHERPVIVTGKRVVIVDLATGQLQRVTSPSKFGTIPWLIDSSLFTLPRSLHPIQPDLARGLDGALIRGLRRSRIDFEWVKHDPHEFRCVDFKSRRGNLTPYEGLARHLGDGDPEPAAAALARWYPADLVELALRTGRQT